MGTGMRGSEKSRHQESAHLWKASSSKHSLSNTYLFEECPSYFFQPSSTSVSNPTALVASAAFLPNSTTVWYSGPYRKVQGWAPLYCTFLGWPPLCMYPLIYILGLPPLWYGHTVRSSCGIHFSQGPYFDLHRSISSQELGSSKRKDLHSFQSFPV